MTSDQCDYSAEYKAFSNTGHDVLSGKKPKSSVYIKPRIYMQIKDSYKITPEYSDGIGEYRKAWEHYDERQETRYDEESDRIECHAFKRFNLLGHFHCTELCAHRRTNSSCYNKTC